MITYTTAKNEDELRGILALQKANLKKNLSEEEIKRDGFVTVDHTYELLNKLHDIAPHIIAKDKSEVVGYVLAMTKKSRFDIPIIFPMFEEFDNIVFKGKTVSDYNYMVVGQACIHKDYRGRGLVERSEEHTSELQSRRHLVCRLLLEKKNLMISSALALLALGLRLRQTMVVPAGFSTSLPDLLKTRRVPHD